MICATPSSSAKVVDGGYVCSATGNRVQMCNISAGCSSSTGLPYTHYKKATSTTTVGTFYTYISTITNWSAGDVVSVLNTTGAQEFYECSSTKTSGCSVIGPTSTGNLGIWNRRFDLINTGSTPVQP